MIAIGRPDGHDLTPLWLLPSLAVALAVTASMLAWQVATAAAGFVATVAASPDPQAVQVVAVACIVAALAWGLPDCTRRTTT